MSSSVRQRLQSWPEPRFVESHFFRLKLAPPKAKFHTQAKPMPHGYNEDKNTQSNQNIDMGGWSSLHSLANTKYSTDHDKVYVHPLVKRSASMLSKKSLEMCTESLGSETGSEVRDSSEDVSLLSLETAVCSPSKPRESLVKRKISRSRSFPPPLTSISGSSGVQVRSHREDGRLVLQAVTIPLSHCYFHTERSEGRLRLSLLKDAAPIIDGEEKEEQEEAVEEEDEENGENVGGGEIGTGKFPRRSSCKESGCGRGHEALLYWEPFLVLLKS